MSSVVDWLAELPAIVLFLGLTLLMLAVSLALTWLAERVFDPEIRSRTSSSVTTLVGVIAALYAVLVAFVIVNEWQGFANAQAQTADESAALTSAFASASALAEPARSEIQNALVHYDRTVLCDEIPFLATHTAPAGPTRQALEDLYQTVARNQPVGDSPFYTSLVNSLNDITSARRNRINAAVSPLPDLLLVVIFVTSIALIATLSALDTQHRRWHIAFMTTMSIVVALNLTLVLSLDRPFAGSARVSDQPYREGLPPAVLECDGGSTTD